MKAKKNADKIAQPLVQKDFQDDSEIQNSPNKRNMTPTTKASKVAKLLTLWTEAMKTETLEDETSKRLSANSEPSR
ncbi:uncharacterized protein BdWA1_003507 [Babesia duncani]|uniref:Uncharacterized protein n=1 Tax=Babesia duncani TaxID=323732 RepID=A0AAD9PHX9_9APIC|nr:hypothetical protein BdWA1_003507 [Babesia duncani]